MAKVQVVRNTASYITRLFVQDTTSTTGAGLTGLGFASSGLSASFIRQGDPGPLPITLVAGTVGTWSSGGFAEVDPVVMPGVYELGVPDTAFSAGASVLLYLHGAANMLPTLLEIEIDSWNNQDGVAGGLSAVTAIRNQTDQFTFTGLLVNATGITYFPTPGPVTDTSGRGGNNILAIPRGTTQSILIPCTNPDGSMFPLTAMVQDIRFLVKLDPADPDEAALITKSLLNGGIVITNPAKGLAVIGLVPSDTNNTIFNALCPLDTVVNLYWGCKLFLTQGIEYDLLFGGYGTLTLNQGAVHNIT